MALNATTFSGKQFKVHIASEIVTGTFNNDDADWRRIDVEGITFPNFNPTQEFEMRTGSGRIAEFDQVFSSTKRVMTEFTLSGRLTQEAWIYFTENACGSLYDGGTGSDSILTLDENYVGQSFKVGTNPTDSQYDKLLSVYFEAPTAADSYSMASCVVTNFSIDADMDSAAGRFNYTATLQTQSTPAKGAVTSTDSDAIGTNFLYLSLWDERNIDIKDYASDGTTDQDDITPLFKTFNFSIDNPTQFLGATGANGTPEVWAKQLPELSITYGGSLKYDDETDNMVEAFRDPSGSSYLTLYLSDIPVTGTTETPTGDFFDGTSAVKFGIWAGKAKLTSCEVSSDDVAMVNFEAKVLKPAGAVDTLHLLGGDNN